ncbi:Sua5/YciO/YrdC/YwlC family protein [bacterium]|nr:Sua5/YciO/YrdC/YwlC family protein [bacterium]
MVYQKIAYRIPNQKQILEILNKLDSLYCTSANISGNDTIKNTDEA